LATAIKPQEVLPEREEEVLVPSTGGNGPGRHGAGVGEWDDGSNEPGAARRWVPLSVYKTAMIYVIVSIVMLFATLSFLLAVRWVASPLWRPIQLPSILYLNTVVLVASSLALQLARSYVWDAKQFGRYLAATLALGLAFMAGQLIAWWQLVVKGVYVASNPGSFFFYTITAIHAAHLLGGILALSWLAWRGRNLRQAGTADVAADVVALYWHFMDGLWVYLLALLFLGVQGRMFGISL
jgi:cytochrome c oxidase subunit III